jgi:CO/xanthine dehydrogenase Mo-binding subunit
VLQVLPLDNWWRAQEALNALTVEWDEGEARRATSATIQEFLRAGLAQENLPVAKKTGDAGAAFAAAKKVIEAEYFAPCLNHATVEPMNCTAWVKGDRVEVWVPTQNGEASPAAASEAAGVPPGNVEVHKMQLGGGFGRRGAFQGYVRQAVAISYAVPNLQVDYAMRNTLVPVGFRRAVGHSQNPFCRECFLDEIAAAGGKDPYQRRRQLLANSSRDLGVPEAAAKAARWGRPLPGGVYRGIAVQNSYGSYAAAMIELSVTAKGEPDTERVVVAVDPGYVVNPDSAQAQIEICVVYGLAPALYGEITIKDGRVEQSNFHDYPMMRMKDMPKVESVPAPGGEIECAGSDDAGEQGSAGAAITVSA